MNISEDVSAGLRTLGNVNVVNEECFLQLLDMSYGTLTEMEKIGNISQLSNCKVDAIKGVYASLLSLLVEVTRNNVDTETLCTILSEDYNFSQSRIEKLVKFYTQHKKSLEASLSNIGIHPPHIVDSTWTLDYCIKINNLEHVGGLQYLIQLHIESCEKEGKETSKIKFVCSHEELQDLVGKLRDALKQVEQIAAI